MNLPVPSPVPGSVSVIIPVWNGARFLERAVASAQAQQGLADLQIVVVDDASTDGTVAVLARLAAEDPRILPVYGTQNRGPAGARNAGLDRAAGEWIAVLDADDAYGPGRLARLVGVAGEGGLDVMADLPVLYDLAADCPAPDAMQYPASGALQRLGFRDFLTPDAATGLDLGLLKPVFHHSLRTRGLLHYPEGLRHGEDCAMYVAMTREGAAFGLLHEAHYLFSTRIGAVSGTRSPGSVTDVDYRAIAAEAERLRAGLAAQGALDAELSAILDRRVATALQQNRRYGWTVLRRGEWRLLWRWLRRDGRNGSEMARMIRAKAMGQRGLPQ